MGHGESAVGAKGTGIKGTSISRLTAIVSDGMEVGGWVVPGNCSTCANVDECRGIIRGECPNSNMQSRWGGYREGQTLLFSVAERGEFVLASVPC
jgi:hypothetical protein